MPLEDIAFELSRLSSSELYDLVDLLKRDYPILYNMLLADLEYV